MRRPRFLRKLRSGQQAFNVMRLLHTLRREDGIALIMALGILFTLTVAGTAAFTYTTSNSRSAQTSKSSEVAYSLAEAGINHALSVLNAALDPRTGNLLPSTTVNLSSGSVTYSGSLDANYVWTITSTGKVTNPNGGNQLQRTLTRKAEVRGLMTGATVGAWSRIYHNNTTYCLEIDTVTIPESVSSAGDICLSNGGKITGTDSKVSVGDDVTLTGSANYTPANLPDNGTGWTDSDEIRSNDGDFAYTSVSGGGSSANLDASDFDFDIPSNATITGIRVRVERQASATSSINDRDVMLLKNGTAVGTDKAAAGNWGTSQTIVTYGGTGDLWGTTWTPADFNDSDFGLRFRVNNASGSSRTANVDWVEVLAYYTVPASSIGVSGTPVSTADVAGTCTYGGNPAHSPCSSADNVFGTTITTLPTDLQKPTIDMAYWYQNAKPGPKHYCNNSGGSYPNGFDDDSWYNNSRQGSDAYEEVTPSGSSYTCKVIENGNTVGEISWNHVTHVLKIQGTIFLDGDFRFDDDGSLVNYQGRGIIYAAGDIEFDELVCAGGNGSANCITNGMANWDPTQNMMIVLSGDDSEYDQGGTQSQSEPSGLQGIVYAKDDCTIHENFHSSGPLICDRIMLPSASNGWPTYYTWPDLGSLIDGQMYGSTATSPDFQLIVGAQSG
jgi:Tfp pilus assembly protein PilX